MCFQSFAAKADALALWIEDAMRHATEPMVLSDRRRSTRTRARHGSVANGAVGNLETLEETSVAAVDDNDFSEEQAMSEIESLNEQLIAKGLTTSMFTKHSNHSLKMQMDSLIQLQEQQQQNLKHEH